MAWAYYNEIDPYAAAWLRNLIAAGHIAGGEVDERSIADVRADDLGGFTQCHFFAGIGVWSYALRLAGWPDDQPVWTGSCPCQPFSAAGKQEGFADDRHLWPEWFRLVGARRPSVVFGEQVASKGGLAWLDTVHDDLEGAGYSVRSADLCAAGFGAPHIRQRLWFVADTERERGRRRESRSADAGDAGESGEARELAYPDGGNASAEGLQRGREHGFEPQDSSAGSRLANHHEAGRGLERGTGLLDGERPPQRDDADGRSEDGVLELAAGEQVGIPGRARQPGATAGFWRDADWIPCIDGKARPVEPGTFPLAHGAPARVGRLRAYGNAIVAPVAAEFIGAYLAELDRGESFPQESAGRSNRQ